MNEQDIENLSLHELEQVDAQCEAYSSAWHSGASPRIEDLIESLSSDLKLVLAIELVELDMELRRSAGETPSIESYCERFPQWADAFEIRLKPVAGNKEASNSNLRLPGYEVWIPIRVRR